MELQIDARADNGMRDKKMLSALLPRYLACRSRLCQPMAELLALPQQVVLLPPRQPAYTRPCSLVNHREVVPMFYFCLYSVA